MNLQQVFSQLELTDAYVIQVEPVPSANSPPPKDANSTIIPCDNFSLGNPVKRVADVNASWQAEIIVSNDTHWNCLQISEEPEFHI